jgi:hypothetical protein
MAVCLGDLLVPLTMIDNYVMRQEHLMAIQVIRILMCSHISIGFKFPSTFVFVTRPLVKLYHFAYYQTS